MKGVLPRGLVAALLAASALTTAACQDHVKNDRATDSVSAMPQAPKALSGPVDTAIIRLTGLLLIVPPSTGTGDTHILIPSAPAGDPHTTLLGFGIPADSGWAKTICSSPRNATLCYVNLRVWTVDPIGSGGTNQLDLEKWGILNVTRGSGGSHHPPLSAGAGPNEVVFAGGAPSDSCALASWTFQAAGASKEDTLNLANVLDWEMHWPQGTPFQLVFRRNGAPPDTVKLPVPATHKLELLLASVPDTEVKYLPPGIPPTPATPKPQAPAPHFGLYYDLLNKPNPVPAGSRPVPHFNSLTSNYPRCAVQITTFRSGFLPAKASLGTFACMPAGGTPP